MDMKALCLIIGYMLRMDDLNESVQEDLEFILSKTPYLIEQMIQMAIILAMEFKMGRSKKRITAKNVLTLIGFSQNVVQGMWDDDDAFLQLPHMNYETLKNLKKKIKNMNLEQYCQMTLDQRQGLAIFEDPKQFADSEKAISCLPVIDVDADYYVEGEKEVAVGDILTIKIVIT